MSGWMIMGLPGSVYSTGLSAMWITIGLTLGAYINYFVVALTSCLYRISWRCNYITRFL